MAIDRMSRRAWYAPSEASNAWRGLHYTHRQEESRRLCRQCMHYCDSSCSNIAVNHPSRQRVVLKSEIDDARSDQLQRAHLFGSCYEFTCLHVWRWSTSEIMSLKLASEFWGLQSKKNWTMKVIVLSSYMWTAHTLVCSDMLL